jgi:uncharacterized protein (TIGR03382 family)
MKPVRLVLACALGFGLAACGKTVSLTDDIDLTWDFMPTPIDKFKTELHSPYVQGAKFNLWVTSNDDNDNVATWSLVSSDEGVLSLGNVVFSDKGSIEFEATALSEGSVHLHVLDGTGAGVGGSTIDVAVPDAIELDAHAYLIMDMPERAPVAEARIATGDTATYLVKYMRGGKQLYGNGALSVSNPPSIDAKPRTSFLNESREWLTMTPSVQGSYSIGLVAGGTLVTSVPFAAVPPSDVADVALMGQTPKGHKKGDELVVLAQAWDGGGNQIFGVDYSWTVDGAAQLADGDLYRYEYDPAFNVMIEAERNGHLDGMSIQSEGGFVDNSNRIGCDAGAGGAGGLVALALAGLLRRRRVSSLPA